MEEKMPQAKLKKEKPFTYGDLCHWPEDERWELIDGVAYDMTPPPLRIHQEISGELHRQLANFFFGKECRVYFAPFGVRFPKENEPDETVKNYVEPDISVVCDPKKLDDKGCRGAPDLVIEILSPSTSSKDHILKRALYEKQGVKEYWLVHPIDCLVTVYQLGKSGKYGVPMMYDRRGKIEVRLFPGLTVDLSSVFPPDTRIVKESPRKYTAKK